MSDKMIKNEKGFVIHNIKLKVENNTAKLLKFRRKIASKFKSRKKIY